LGEEPFAIFRPFLSPFFYGYRLFFTAFFFLLENRSLCGLDTEALSFPFETGTSSLYETSNMGFTPFTPFTGSSPPTLAITTLQGQTHAFHGHSRKGKDWLSGRTKPDLILLLKPLDDLLQAPNKLPSTLFDIDTDLGNELPCKSKLRQGESRNRKLADTDNTYPELGDIEDAAAELANGYHPLGNNRDLIGAKLERDMQKGKA
jgi:hypothetical protein